MSINSSEGKLLQSLPYWLQAGYPADARYAVQGKYQLHKLVSCAFESLVISYLSSE